MTSIKTCYTLTSRIETTKHNPRPGIISQLQPPLLFDLPKSNHVPHNIEMKKLMPFNKFIDQRNIVDAAEEWLYDDPDFLEFDLSMEKEMHIAAPKLLNKSFDEFREYFVDPSGPTPAGSASSQTPLLEEDNWKSTIRGIIIDVANPLRFDGTQRRKGRRQDPEYDLQCMTNEGFYQKLKPQRTMENAMKRLIWSPNADFSTAVTYFLASIDTEKPLMLSFFERHF